MDMTEITIRIPQAGALRLLEESIKAGVSPDRFIAQLIEERLKRPSTPAPSIPAQPQMPELNAAGLNMLRKLSGRANPMRTRQKSTAARPVKKRGKK
jgi:hypothetical protein